MPKNNKHHAALLASPGMGHLIPIVGLGKRMATHHDFHVTIFFIASDHGLTTSLLKSPTVENLDIVPLPLVDISALVGPNTQLVEKLIIIVRESLPSLRSLIAAMKYRPSALIVDLFGADAFDIAEEFGMLKYVFNTANAWCLAAILHSSRLGNKFILEHHIKGQKPLEIPGCKSLSFEDTPESLRNIDRSGQLEFHGFKMTNSHGILINTWEDLESSTIEALRDNNHLRGLVKVPIYPIGPLVGQDGNQALDKQVKQWLDKQPIESVIYVSFGSGSTLSATQMTELAWGLEQSQQKFIWVVRPPSNNAVGTYFTIGKDDVDGTPDYLPQGFFTRTKEIGLVIPMWAPQVQILSHPSVGGFLSHCGWNSTLESIMNGVPMIAWPLYAEQKMNAAMLTEDFEIAVRPKVSTTEEIVGREVIGNMVITIMADKEGKAMRDRVKELKNRAEKALCKGGSSFNFLSQVAKDCMHHLLA
ncbi:putative UDP-glucosyl transferase 72E1 [Hibiscus syriacus]|uniref:Glycosyltransferase n=1 Tax=Hibiscus syriacus TaxID=106335 RepID=A0A6A2ZVY8_HIBSY|nr:anthocyanidin 3-O-glucosyltransferase 5-like [Hibiscus syriacus]KAE8695913.1 putative UDP-glucosyl transferase 72E1 [Hibiscus syriacus]